MAELEQLPHCCGIHELGYVRDDDGPEDVLMSFSWDELSAHVIFSVTSRETARHQKGLKLAAFIREHKLGAIVATPRAAKNPGHTGTIRAWMWTPNKQALRKWQARMKKADPNKYYTYKPYDYYGGGW